MVAGSGVGRRALCREVAALSAAATLGWSGTAFGKTVKPEPPKLEKVRKTRAEGLLGQPVLDGKRQTIGHIVNVLIDTEGRPQAAVVEFTGFLGVGDRKVAVAWKALHFALDHDQIVISVALDVTALRAMPEYDSNAKSVPVATPPRPAPGTGPANSKNP